MPVCVEPSARSFLLATASVANGSGMVQAATRSAATVSIIAVIWLALPYAADRLAPLVPDTLERRIGDAAEGQIRFAFGGKACSGNVAGRAAFFKLMRKLSTAAIRANSTNLRVSAFPFQRQISGRYAFPALSPSPNSKAST